MVIGGVFANRTVGELWFKSAPGTAITISPVPEPTSLAPMLAGGLAVAGAALRHRRRSDVAPVGVSP